MPCSNSYSKLGYAKLVREDTAGDAKFPDTLLEIFSEGISLNWDSTPSSPIAGNRSANVRPIKSRVGPFTGTLEVPVQSKTIGNLLLAVCGEDAHLALDAGVSEQSDFEPLNTLETLTLDIKAGSKGYVTRYFGVRFSKVMFRIDENQLKAAIDITAQRVFSNARLTADKSSGTSLPVDQTSGLTTDDTLLVIDKDDPDTTLAELTIAALPSETEATVSTISATLEEDDIVVIKADAISDEDFDVGNELIFSGGADVLIGNGQDALQKLAAKTNCEDFELSIENELEPRWAATGADVVDRMPGCIQLKGVRVSGKFSQFLVNPAVSDMLRSNEQTGLRFRFYGAELDSNSAAAAGGTVETDGVGTVDVTVDAAGEDGNDYAIWVELGTGALSAALVGKMITVTLDATPANNTTTLVAAAIDGLTGVSSSSTGADLVTAAENPSKIHFSAGRDASEKEMLRFDVPDARFLPFRAPVGNDDVMEEDIEYTAFRDERDGREVHVRLRNDVTSY